MTNEQWYILDRDGNVMEEASLPERPEDARPTQNGEVYTPWYKQDEHVHVEEGVIAGIHARGTLEDVRETLSSVLKNEKELLAKFGGKDDILLKDALTFSSTIEVSPRK